MFHGMQHQRFSLRYGRYQRWYQEGLWDRICAILHPTPTPFSTG
jgi:hypothetical protein